MISDISYQRVSKLGTAIAFDTVFFTVSFEPQRQKTYLGHVRPVKIQISLRIRAVWSESSLGAFWIASDAMVLPVDNEDFYQTVRMCRLLWAYVGRTCQKVRFLTLRNIYSERLFELANIIELDWVFFKHSNKCRKNTGTHALSAMINNVENCIQKLVT